MPQLSAEWVGTVCGGHHVIARLAMHRPQLATPELSSHSRLGGSMEFSAALWDPREIDPDVWQQVDVDPSMLSTDIAGRPDAAGFKRCGGIDRPRAYAIDVWSQRYTLDDFRRKESAAEFVPVTIADRAGFRFRPRSDHSGDQCSLIFPAVHGSYSISVLRLDPHSPVAPADRAIEVAQVMVPLLPD